MNTAGLIIITKDPEKGLVALAHVRGNQRSDNKPEPYPGSCTTTILTHPAGKFEIETLFSQALEKNFKLKEVLTHNKLVYLHKHPKPEARFIIKYGIYIPWHFMRYPVQELGNHLRFIVRTDLKNIHILENCQGPARTIPSKITAMYRDDKLAFERAFSHGELKSF